MENKILAEKKFTSRVRSETAYGVRADYGECENTMRLIQGKENLLIEWTVGTEKEPIDEAEIGIWTAGKKVIEYDGVFELPKEAIEMLNKFGLDTKEIEN